MAKIKKEKLSKSLIKKSSIIRKKFNEYKTRKYFIFFLLLIVLGVVLYLTKGSFIAAVVNGRLITRRELTKQLERQAGKETLDNLVTKKLIFLEAKKQGIEVNSTDITAEIDKISKNIEAQGSTLDAALSLQGQTRADLEESITIQKTVEQLLKDNIQVSEDDIKAYFDENKEIFASDAKYEELKDSIADQLMQEKMSQEFQTWMEKLRGDSQVVYFVNF